MKSMVNVSEITAVISVFLLLIGLVKGEFAVNAILSIILSTLNQSVKVFVTSVLENYIIETMTSRKLLK